MGGAVDGGRGLDFGVLKAFGEVGASECGEALAECELGGDVFGFEFSEFVEDFGGHDFGAGPGEGGEAVGLAFVEGGGEVEVDGVGGDLGVGVGEAGEGDVEVAVVAIDVGDLIGDGFGGVGFDVGLVGEVLMASAASAAWLARFVAGLGSGRRLWGCRW